ncbi:hypothetical protein DOY81_010146 [Sarcophaga bullata]|nr:hypothetical protein DOY81_010146 [Sarcophaga bullata]
MEMTTINPLHMGTGLIIDPNLAATTSTGLLSKRGSFVALQVYSISMILLQFNHLIRCLLKILKMR